MNLFKSMMIIFSLLLFSDFSMASEGLPAHNGKCGVLQSSNMGKDMDQCKVGDVVIVQKKVVPMYCDYRYAIHNYGGTGATSTYSCILRVLRKNRNN